MTLYYSSGACVSVGRVALDQLEGRIAVDASGFWLLVTNAEKGPCITVPPRVTCVHFTPP